MIYPLLNLFAQVALRVRNEREMPRQQRIVYYSARPYVNSRPFILLARHQLRSHIRRGAAHKLQSPFYRVIHLAVSGETEVK